MSYFEGLKLTKKGEQLQAKINGNLSETLTFTKAKLGSGSITSNDEIRFLTDVKEEWGTANVTSCKIQGDEKNIVAIEVQFSNAELREDKIFREVGLYAQGNEGEEILYAYANAGDKYDYIPLMKDSPHSFVLVFYFNITSGSKVDAKIDLHSYITHQEFNEEMSKKVNKTDYASAEQYGIVKYGTQGNTALEGNKIEEITGKTYGGVLNEIGLKEAGKTYFDKNTKKLYLCKNNNTDVSANINNYIAMDSHSILERLENLIKIKKYSATTQDYISINGGTLIISESRIDNLKNKIGIPLNSTIVSVSTGQSVGYCEYCTYNYESDTAIVGHIVPSGNSRTVVINVAYI
ncbi:phage tail protein [Fusobacterium pseudoperiodonticum]|uniref:phage tail protein n=1 Tax=Fusobacterium pseudoperiodonticum TaxID=2663009 RepID=UPI001E480A9C|nr:phage tail protein [Fusobacterium pseudoperiodonticum]